jgi:isoleucyl-tRNA synthetase
MLARWREEELFRRTLEQTADAEQFVFFEGRRRRTGGRASTTCSAARSRTSSAATRRCAAVTSRASRAGTRTGCRWRSRRRSGSASAASARSRGRHRAFNEVCRESVFTYKEDWERLSERIGYWLDYSDPYVTFEPRYIESVWWILKQLARARPDLPRPQERAVLPALRHGAQLARGGAGLRGRRGPVHLLRVPALGRTRPRAFLVWTTTPWTLPSNVALACTPTRVRRGRSGMRAMAASVRPRGARVEALFGEDARVLRRFSGAELEGTRYERPFDLIPAGDGAERAWRVVLEDFVTAEDGTGIVHLAPAFGADDYAAGQRHGLPMYRPVDDAGRFREGMPLVGGHVREGRGRRAGGGAARAGRVFRYSLETHSYPHCWRCRSPLLYMARDSWYIRTTPCASRCSRTTRRSRGTRRRSARAASASGSRATSTGRSRGSATGARRCRSGCATATRVEHTQRWIGSFASWRAGGHAAGAVRSAQAVHRRGDVGVRVRRHHAAHAGSRSTSGSIRARCRTRSGTTRSRTRNVPEALPGGLHLRGRRPDARLVLLADGHLHDARTGPAYRNVVVNDLVLDAEGQKMSKSRGNVVDPWGRHRAASARTPSAGTS